MNRHQARELAMKALYQMDVGRGDPHALLAYLGEEDAADGETVARAGEIVEGVLAHRREIDRTIAERSHDWPLERLAAVDRNILRVAVWELLHCPDTPPPVAVDEAVELAKTYGGADSSRFVNGILGSLVRSLEPHHP
ncbi:MAG: transcription antitermination factor NusB [Firmicutes bacterium]|nr:transcription antitermination factor NusB [Bacillota bacterium]